MVEVFLVSWFVIGISLRSLVQLTPYFWPKTVSFSSQYVWLNEMVILVIKSSRNEISTVAGILLCPQRQRHRERYMWRCCSTARSANPRFLPLP